MKIIIFNLLNFNVYKGLFLHDITIINSSKQPINNSLTRLVKCLTINLKFINIFVLFLMNQTKPYH